MTRHVARFRTRAGDSQGRGNALSRVFFQLLLVVGLVLSLTVVAPGVAQAANCTTTAPNVHDSSERAGRLNFKPFVRCSSPQSKQLILQAKVQRKMGSTWVTETWVRTTLDNRRDYVRGSLAKDCVTGTYRGMARHMDDSGVWSAWKYSNVTSSNCPNGGGGGGFGSWRANPVVS